MAVTHDLSPLRFSHPRLGVKVKVDVFGPRMHAKTSFNTSSTNPGAEAAAPALGLSFCDAVAECDQRRAVSSEPTG